MSLIHSRGPLILVPPLWPLAPLEFAGYALATGAEAVRVAAPLGPRGIATAWAIFPVLDSTA